MAVPKEIATAQDLTGSWADLGAEITTDGHGNLTLWLIVDANNSTSIQIRFMNLHASGGDEYCPVNKSESTGTTTVYQRQYLIGDSGDRKITINHPLNKVEPYIKVQIKAGVVGATAGKISAKYTLR